MKKNVYITFEGKDYTREDLTEDQINFADKLEIVTKQMNMIKKEYELFLVLNDYKEIYFKSFKGSLNHGSEEDKDNS